MKKLKLLFVAGVILMVGTGCRGKPYSCPGCHLEYKNFVRSNLQGANLKGAYLQGANFQDADLSNADLTGAHDADLTGANLRGATMPNGSKNP